MTPEPWRDTMRFLGSFLRRPRSIGAVLPSSRYLAEALVGRLDLRDDDLVVEFGPGTGPITSVIRERMLDTARYLGIERDRLQLREARGEDGRVPRRRGRADHHQPPSTSAWLGPNESSLAQRACRFS